MTKDELDEKFPWLPAAERVSRSVVVTLYDKEQAYQGSWQARGGVGAFMMAARKWDRIENIAQGEKYDIFAAQAKNTGDVVDDIDDLIGYLLLIRGEAERRKSNGV